MENLTKSLPVKLNDTELRERAKKLGETIAKHDGLEVQKKLAADSFKAQIENTRADIIALASVVTTGEEYREVPVTTQKNFDRSLVEVIRADTGEVVDSRAMTADERQAGLFDEREANPDGEQGTPAKGRRRRSRETTENTESQPG